MKSRTMPETSGEAHFEEIDLRDSVNDSPDSSANGPEKTILTEDDCREELPVSFPRRKKWLILTIKALVQVSM